MKTIKIAIIIASILICIFASMNVYTDEMKGLCLMLNDGDGNPVVIHLVHWEYYVNGVLIDQADDWSDYRGEVDFGLACDIGTYYVETSQVGTNLIISKTYNKDIGQIVDYWNIVAEQEE